MKFHISANSAAYVFITGFKQFNFDSTLVYLSSRFFCFVFVELLGSVDLQFTANLESCQLLLLQMFFCFPLSSPWDSNYTCIRLIKVVSQLTDGCFVHLFFLNVFFNLCISFWIVSIQYIFHLRHIFHLQNSVCVLLISLLFLRAHVFLYLFEHTEYNSCIQCPCLIIIICVIAGSVSIDFFSSLWIMFSFFLHAFNF